VDLTPHGAGVPSLSPPSDGEGADSLSDAEQHQSSCCSRDTKIDDDPVFSRLFHRRSPHCHRPKKAVVLPL
jgi:hypothetical protein